MKPPKQKTTFNAFELQDFFFELNDFTNNILKKAIKGNANMNAQYWIQELVKLEQVIKYFNEHGTVRIRNQ